MGDSAVCEITNDDDEPQLILKKVVINNGGAATADQWTLTASGPSGFSGPGPTVDSDVEVTDFLLGTYDLSESAVAGYSSTGIWACVGSGTVDDDDTVTLLNGENLTCTITNTDDEPQLVLIKELDFNNGGLATESDWVLTATRSTRTRRRFERAGDRHVTRRCRRCRVGAKGG